MPIGRNWNFAWNILHRFSEETCLIDAATGEMIKSLDLSRAIISFAAQLLSLGLQPKDVILVGCTLSPASAIAYLGSMYAGLVPLPLDDSTIASSAVDLVRRIRARAVWTLAPVVFEGSIARDIKIVTGHPSTIRTTGLQAYPNSENDLACLMTTSGSTGSPRFVMVSHLNLIANTEAIIRSQRLAKHDRAMLVLPLTYCFGASVLHTHLYVGGSVILDRRFMFPDKVLRAINTHRCTTFAGVPTAYAAILRKSNIRNIQLPTLRRFLQAGGRLAPRLIIEMRSIVPHCNFFVMYGQTEATARISCLSPQDLDRKLGSVGVPLDNICIKIASDGGCIIPSGQVGEIAVSGPSVTLGYFEDPEATHLAFKDGWLYTGDLGRVDNDGYLWIEGRKGSFLKMRGFRVGIHEIESAVMANAGVSECMIVPVEDQDSGEAFLLYIVPTLDHTNVDITVKDSFPKHWSCKSIHIVPTLPVTARGKILSRDFLHGGSPIGG